MEGPSLVILRNELQPFLGRKVLSARGNTHQTEPAAFIGKSLKEILSWGKHLILRIGKTDLRIHFLMYGSYRINQPKEGRDPRLSLKFKNGELYFYSCSIQELPENPHFIYDWSTDPMSESWSELKAIRAIESRPGEFVCDLLLDQSIFSGVGNIIKNEVLFRMHLHPLTLAGTLSRTKIRNLVRETRQYCFQFLEWKQKFELKKNWKIYRQKSCPTCLKKPTFSKTGKKNRISFFCGNCQTAANFAAKKSA